VHQHHRLLRPAQQQAQRLKAQRQLQQVLEQEVEQVRLLEKRMSKVVW